MGETKHKVKERKKKLVKLVGGVLARTVVVSTIFPECLPLSKVERPATLIEKLRSGVSFGGGKGENNVMHVMASTIVEHVPFTHSASSCICPYLCTDPL